MNPMFHFSSQKIDELQKDGHPILDIVLKPGDALLVPSFW
jgi:ribosomal protein L16 Arg81 hydroxylase